MAACDQSRVVWCRRHDSESSHSLEGPEWPLCANVGHPRHTELRSKADRLTQNGDVNKLLSSYLAGRHAVCLPANY